MNGKFIICIVVLMGVVACSSQPRIEDTIELSCPKGEPTNMSISVSAKQRLRSSANKKRCTLDFDNTYKTESIGKPNAVGKCSVVVSAVCK